MTFSDKVEIDYYDGGAIRVMLIIPRVLVTHIRGLTPERRGKPVLSATLSSVRNRNLNTI